MIKQPEWGTRNVNKYFYESEARRIADLNEIFGENAKEVALKHELPLAYKNDIASISFPTTKEGQKSLAQCIQRVKLVAFTHQELLQWYHSNKL